MRRLVRRLEELTIYPWGRGKDVGAMIDRLRGLWAKVQHAERAPGGTGAPAALEDAVVTLAREIASEVESRYGT